VPNAADDLLAALNAIEHPQAGDDSGPFKTRRGWEKEWGKGQKQTGDLIRRAVAAGLMESRMEYRNLGGASRQAPVYRLVNARPHPSQPRPRVKA
jgi:hypothetical protein